MLCPKIEKASPKTDGRGSVDVYLTGVHLMGVCLMGVYLTGVYRKGVCLLGEYVEYIHTLWACIS